MREQMSIFWFRQDLRLSDNPGLIEASKAGKVLAIYILDEAIKASMGGASKIYLHHSIDCLNQSLEGCLNIYKGEASTIIFQLIAQYNIENIFWNRCYEPWQVSIDAGIEKKLHALKIHYAIHNANYLYVPEDITKEDGSFYKVFGAYKRKTAYSIPRKPLSKPEHCIFVKDTSNLTKLDDLSLIPQHTWHNSLSKHWTYGEDAAHTTLDYFLAHALSGYKKGRDYPGTTHTSRLSAHLHFGEISPQYVWHAVERIAKSEVYAEDVEHFLSELLWREFSNYLLAHRKDIATVNFNRIFDAFPWGYNAEYFNAWKTGKTGYPMVDAGMRELWQTGYMHNRLRMIVASFLVKNMLIHWHYGRDWFWDCLVDADCANNSVNWQWVAGSGVDAAPYFRIFNPITQGEKFDGDGRYIRKFVPELDKLPNKYLCRPFDAPLAVLEKAGVILGENYPLPIVDLRASRGLALQAYHHMKS